MEGPPSAGQDNGDSCGSELKKQSGTLSGFRTVCLSDDSEIILPLKLLS